MYHVDLGRGSIGAVAHAARGTSENQSGKASVSVARPMARALGVAVPGGASQPRTLNTDQDYSKTVFFGNCNALFDLTYEELKRERVLVRTKRSFVSAGVWVFHCDV